MRQVDGEETTVAVCETADRRGVIEVLRTRAHLLAGKDRALLEMYMERGSSIRQIGRLMGLTAPTVGRRIRKIICRLTDDTYEICLSDHDDFSGRELAVIKDHFVCGLTKRRISRNHAVSLYRVRMILQKARKYAVSIKASETRNWSIATAQKGGNA